MNRWTRDEDPHGTPGWNQNPPYLAPELTTRASLVCGGKKSGEYNLPLHVIALFLVLAASIGGCVLPLMVKKFPQLKVPHYFLFLSRHFGTGVLISTAFVHLLPTAFTSLTDPCLPPFWNKGYPQMAGLIAMMSVFVVVTVEMIFSILQGGHSAHCHSGTGGEYDVLADHDTTPIFPKTTAFENGGRGSVGRHRRSGSLAAQLQRMDEDDEEYKMSSLSPQVNGTEPLSPARTSDGSDSDSDDDLVADIHPATPVHRSGNRARSYSGSSRRAAPSNGRLTEQQQQQKALLQVILLEAGILFHSIFIGMALSVAAGSNFIVLLIAILFHQTFEGLALGSRIAAINVFEPGSLKPWLMVLAYGTTTPIGQAIGLITRNLYDPNSEMGLLMVGIMNAISSGLLLFAGLVELLAEDFLSDDSYATLKGKRRIHACVSVMAGAVGMALVGAWA